MTDFFAAYWRITAIVLSPVAAWWLYCLVAALVYRAAIRHEGGRGQ